MSLDDTADNLPERAKIAYQAFLDMRKSKEAYFSLLQELDSKYEAGGTPGIAENLQLEKLLATHDKNVLAFQTAMTAVEDKDARNALIKLMS